MKTTLGNAGSIRDQFRSVVNILIHFSLSLIQFVSILAILALQIALTLTETCAYRIGIGYWSFPFLLISPLSIWLVMWQRNTIVCFIAILIHFCSTLFATAIMIVSFLVLIDQIDLLCTPTSFDIILNSSIIGITVFFKLFNYGEVILLYLLLRNHDETSTEFIQDDHDEDKDHSTVSKSINVNIWRSWSAVTDDTQKNADMFFA